MKLRTYNSYKDTKVEWIGQIPSNWDSKKIKYLSPVKRGASPRPIDDPKYFEQEGKFAWVRIADVSASGKYLINTTQAMSRLGSSLSVKLYPGELFLSIAGTVGKPCITNINCCIHDGFVYFPKLAEEFREYLFYVFESGQPYKGLGKLGTQLNLNTQTVGDIIIPIPSEQEIKKIIEFIREADEGINKAIILRRKQIETLQEYRDSLISETVTRGLDPDVKMKDSGTEWIGLIPEHWELKKAKYIFKEISKKNFPKEELLSVMKGRGLVPRKDIESGVVMAFKDLQNFKLVEPKEFVIHLRSFQSGFEYSKIRGIVSPAYTVFKNRYDVVSEYFKYMFYSKTFINVLSTLSLSLRDGKPISFRDFGNMVLCLPPIKEQTKISNYLVEKTNEIENTINKLSCQINTLEKYRQSLIYEAVTGKTDVRNYKQSDLEVKI
ncbi:restriction endonuclease subunit S [Rossellomorea aquimaris]|uniref:restriction endonuclease subunit S n=1 Tax=Rossellomorea aquimaris TaxID=189382 RepID=UPI0011E96AA4|nr:restriction endonuclease subunit S [Rossellomorea aquimaris]TYS87719.1 restriction endonuclease subunit S [Rossellomorea aquimaris]